MHVVDISLLAVASCDSNAVTGTHVLCQARSVIPFDMQSSPKCTGCEQHAFMCYVRHPLLPLDNVPGAISKGARGGGNARVDHQGYARGASLRDDRVLFPSDNNTMCLFDEGQERMLQ